MSHILLYGDSFRNSNIYFATGFLVPDPVFVLREDTTAIMAVSPLELERARKEASIRDVRSFNDLGYQEAVDQTGRPLVAMATIMETLLRDQDTETVQVEAGFPAFLADELRRRNIKVEPTEGLLVDERRKKTSQQVEALARAQSRAEQAVSQARDMLAEAEIGNGSLIYRGVPLTAERMRAELEVSFLRDGFGSDALIVAPGPRSSDPHWTGEGPIKANEPLILDLFPQERSSRYFGDITRTYVKGTPHPEIQRMFEAVATAHSLVLDMVAPGVNGRDVHQAVVESFAEAGYNDKSNARYIHGTGHGLGLDVHEMPRMGRIDCELLEGDVVTVEPGLYDPQLGGVRLEDVVVITATGNRNLNKLPKDLVVD